MKSSFTKAESTCISPEHKLCIVICWSDKKKGKKLNSGALTKDFVTLTTSLGFPAVFHSQNESARHACTIYMGLGITELHDRLQGVYFSLFYYDVDILIQSSSRITRK